MRQALLLCSCCMHKCTHTYTCIQAYMHTRTHTHHKHTQIHHKHTDTHTLTQQRLLFKTNKLNPLGLSCTQHFTPPRIILSGSFTGSTLTHTQTHTDLILHLSLYSLPIPHTARIKIEKQHEGGGNDTHRKPHQAGRDRGRGMARKEEMERNGKRERMKEGAGVCSKLKVQQ